MQQVFLECSQLNQLDVFSSRQEYLFEKTVFKQVGNGDFETTSKGIFAAPTECDLYYIILDYHHKDIICVKFERFLHLGRQRSESELDHTQIKFTSILTDENTIIDYFISNIHQNLNYDKNYFLMLIDKCVNLISDYNEINSGVATNMTIDWAVPGIVRPGSGIDDADLEVFGPGGPKGRRAISDAYAV